jgi:hypothetical protein
MSIIHRKDANGQRIPYVVPAAIPEYNNSMHGADVWDQIRKDFGMDLLHRTGKWTVRIFEILWSFIVTQAYNIYRYNNRNNNQRKLTAHQFKLAVIEGLTNHQVVVGHIINDQIANLGEHQLVQWPNGSRSRNFGETRRFQSACRHCPDLLHNGLRNSNRMTTWYYSYCMVGFHPDCFHDFHKDKPHEYRPKDDSLRTALE